MRFLFWVGGILAVLWSGYWVVGARLLDRTVEDMFAAQGAAGRVAEAEDIAVAGFPNRFDLTLTAPHLADPGRGFGWRAPFAQVFAMTWKPWHVIAVVPSGQVIEGPFGTVTVSGGRIDASLMVRPEAAAGFVEAVVAGDGLVFDAATGETATLARMRLSVAEDATRAATYRLGALLEGLSTPRLADLATAELLHEIGLIHLDAHVRLSAALDRFAAETRPKVMGLDLGDLRVEWGQLKLNGTGSLEAGADGLAEGRIEVTVENWRLLPEALVTLGAVQPDQTERIARALDLLARGGADPNVLVLPLVMAGGRTSLGPLPLGPAPRLN